MSSDGLLGDGPVDVRDDDFVVPVPQVDGALAAARALVLRGDAESHVVGAFLQFQTGLAAEAQQRWKNKPHSICSQRGDHTARSQLVIVKLRSVIGCERIYSIGRGGNV